MGARAEKNPVLRGHYPSLDTPLQVTEAGPDPRPGIDAAEGGPWSKGNESPDPMNLLTPFNKIPARYPMGEETKNDRSIGGKGKR